ncbi:hypothetical protein PHMEG_00012332 [Phytophthora megakarya]|uniref:Integrase catalytic domain-containing protein n=1 Tax=Phytophthora megakarya TaxID=4795 RepID=A0A225WBK8_9STRA|nr:hypothetical protein PHMEG_00012332 [Phytophthora megakarya]
MVPTVMESRTGKRVCVRLTNVSDGTARCYNHSSVVLRIPKGELPREVRYVRLDSSKYNEWQVLAYAEGRNDTLLRKEKGLYEGWLAEQPPARVHLTFQGQMKGYDMNSHYNVRMRDESEASVAAGVDDETGEESYTHPTELSDVGNDEKDPAEDSVDMLDLTYISVMHEIEAEITAGNQDTDEDDFAVHAAALYQLKEEDFESGGDLSVARQSFARLQQKIDDAPILRHFERQKEVHVTLFANKWALSSTLMQEHESKMHPVRLCGRVLKEAEMNYHPAEKEVLALLLLLKTCYTQLTGRTIHVYTRFSTLEWVHTSKSLFRQTTQFAVMLSPWHLVATRVKENDYSFAQLLQAGLTSFVDLEDSLATVTSPTMGSSTVRMYPQLLYVRLPRSYNGPVVSFKRISQNREIRSAYLEATTVNMAEYSGMNNGVQAALDIGATDLVIVGDSRLAIQQSLMVIAWYVMGKAVPETTALRVGQAFEECVYRRFGAPSLIRHDRDPRFMSEAFQSFPEMMQSRSRETLSYRPQANGQQERSDKTVMQSVRVYAEDPLQQDWDEITEKLIFAINNSMDTTTLFLVHGWDAQSTLMAMSSSLKRGLGRQSDALAWRREVNRQQEIAWKMAKEYQTTEKARRAKKHNESLRGREKCTVPGTGRTVTLSDEQPATGAVTDDSDSNATGATKSLFEVGGRVWLYMERAKTGLTKKLAHRWHGPFRVKRKVEEFAYKLEIPDRSA